MKENSQYSDIIKYMLIMSVLFALIYRGTEKLGYHWQWYRVPQYFFTIQQDHIIPGPLIEGLIVTFQITGVSFILAFSIGLTAACFRLSESFIARSISRIYLELIRNTPLLVQLFFIYFVLSPILNISRFASAVIALSLFEGAYASEIFRSGIVSIHKGQWEASFSLGLGTMQTYFYIIFPQAVRRIVPPLISQTISLIKDSALVSVIAISDLTMQGQIIIAETYLTFELWFTIALIYLIITLTISFGVNYLNIYLKFSVKKIH